jgi:hypothetical protein
MTDTTFLLITPATLTGSSLEAQVTPEVRVPISVAATTPSGQLRFGSLSR